MLTDLILLVVDRIISYTIIIIARSISHLPTEMEICIVFVLYIPVVMLSCCWLGYYNRLSSYAGGGGGGSRACFKCGEDGHISRECPKGGGGGMLTFVYNNINRNLGCVGVAIQTLNHYY